MCLNRDSLKCKECETTAGFPYYKSSGAEHGETGASGEPATPAEEFSGVLKHSPSNAPEVDPPASPNIPPFEGEGPHDDDRPRFDNPKSKNLQEGLVNELRRNRELVKEYEKIGPAGVWGKKIIEGTIFAGEEALKSGDAVKMLKAYKALKDCK